MPIFEYRCSGCGREFEALVRASTQPACPQCGSAQVDKLLSVFATASSSSSQEAAFPASPCGGCGSPGGPGSCQFQ